MIAHKGFTLVELLIVLVIMILGISLVGPNISSGSDRASLKAASRDLKSALRYARGQALISQQEITLSLDLATNQYKINSRHQKNYQLSPTIEITLRTAQSDIQSDQRGNIRFFPDGSSTGGSIILSQAKFGIEVSINWLTGHIEINDVDEP
ncbi:MAG: GspH/FimT family pseudopilin [Methylococcales bacterium]|nr:GspH/FimT family pseudopilin [Methylococcales bacterium]